MALVTLLLTDLQGSTALWEQDAAAMAVALAWHDELMGRIVGEHGGAVVKPRGEGDSIFAVFDHPAGAVAAAVALQVALADSERATGVALRVRMAVHTGEVEERDGDFYGRTVNRCARVRGAAHGGQVVLTADAVEAVGEGLPDGASVLDLGSHLLKDLHAPEPVFQLCHPALRAAFPPLASLDPGPDNLPVPRGTFVGRDGDVTGLARLLAEERLVTVVGTGGVGKTRLAVGTARSLAGRFPGGRWFVDLTRAQGEDPVLRAVATALALTVGPGTSLTEAIVSRLRYQAALVVLDNCEHLLEDAATAVEVLLDSCPQLQVLATSRERLHVHGELCWQLAPLPVPAEGGIDLETARRFSAVELFCDRAARVAPDLELGDGDAPLIALLCRRLDGLPLSVELAAARAWDMSVPEILKALDDRFELLEMGRRTSGGRHHSLEALIGWSYDLLDPEEQRFLRCLGMLRGSFDAATAAEVADTGPEVARGMLDELVERSLVVHEQQSPMPYRLLESIREYAAAKLDEHSERPAVVDRHLNAFAGLAHRLAVDDDRFRIPQRRARLRAVGADLRAALDAALVEGREPEALTLGRGIYREAAEQREGYLALGRALALPAGDSVLRSEALAVRAWLEAELGSPETGERMAWEAVEMARRLGHAGAEAIGYNSIAMAALEKGDGPACMAAAEAQLSAAERAGSVVHLALAYGSKGVACDLLEDHAGSYRAHEQALPRYAEAGDVDGVAVTHVNLGALALVEGALEDCRAHLAEAERIFDELDDARGRLWAAWGMGAVALTSGALDEASGWLRRALSLARTVGPLRVACILGSVAAHAAARNRLEDAAVIEAAAEELGYRDEVQAFKGPGVPTPTELNALLEQALDDDVLEEARVKGRALGLTAAVTYALAALNPQEDDRP